MPESSAGLKSATRTASNGGTPPYWPCQGFSNAFSSVTAAAVTCGVMAIAPKIGITRNLSMSSAPGKAGGCHSLADAEPTARRHGRACATNRAYGAAIASGAVPHQVAAACDRILDRL